jgi:hypothetical protein
VTEVLILFQRPFSMSESEMRAWIDQRARTGRPAVALDGSASSASEPRLLRVEVLGDADQAAGDDLSDLMLDMSLLGMSPTVVSTTG